LPIDTEHGPRIAGLLESALYVDDLQRSLEFYQSLMGFPCYLHDSRMCALGMPGHGVLLLFRKGGSSEPTHSPVGTIPAHDGRGSLHLAFAIPARDLDGWANRLAANGLHIESRVTWPRGGTSLYFRDPDGHSLELATPGLWPNDAR
jgi:catechol 2,3-dioxygenase-like lactoylglutathione lyase family enzyme